MIHEQQAGAGGVYLLTPADRIDLACDDFERQWRAGPPPAIEEYLERCDAAERSDLFTELLLVEIDQRKARHDVPTFAEYQARFAEFSAEVAAVWRRLGNQETVVLGSTDTPTDRFSPGMRIAQFELVQKLGAGGAGEVWKALDTQLQRTVAIKMPRQQQLSEDAMQRFLREGRAAAQLRHSHLVTVHMAGQDGPHAYIVSDYIDGEDLRAWLGQHRPTPREAAQLAADVAEALHHAHEQGVIHRDLKPANILMDKSNQAHVTDFGLAKWVEDVRDMTVDGQILGTPAYMSPEQARGEAQHVDRRTDVYALGTLFYELIARRRPFEGDQATVMHHIASTEPKPPRAIDASIPRDLDTICLKALEKDPAKRYPSAQEMAVDLRRYLRGEPILARRISPAERAIRWVRRRPAVAASILLALVAIGSLGLARMFAEENRQLLGIRTVTISTVPVGARVTFVPLNAKTNEPMPDQMIRARAVSPVVEDLRPGDYLVVAVLGDGRFHEVLRKVPEKEENLPGPNRHLRWTIRDGMVELPEIDIPEHSVTKKMAFIHGTEPVTEAKGKLPEIAGPRDFVASFYVDFGEVTVADYTRNFEQAPPFGNWVKVPDDHAVTVYYDFAVALAEKMGKRLPTVEEYEHVASCRGASKWPWGDEPPPEIEITEFGPVGTPAFDRLQLDPRVTGLCSNVAEWTMSSASNVRVDPAIRTPLGQKPLELHVLNDRFQGAQWVVGGDDEVLKGNATVAPEHRGPMPRPAVQIRTYHPGLGFRGVRSARPRETPEAFRPARD